MEKNDSIVPNSAYQDLINLISEYPIGTMDSNHDNFLKYQETGEKKYFDMLVNSNIHYVISIASRYARYLSRSEFIDIIHNGILGLIESIKNYDPNKGAFLTYATSWIKKGILIKLDETEELIRKPSYMNQLMRRYEKLINSKNDLSDKEICDILAISPKTLLIIRESFNTKISASLDEQISDINKKEISFFIADKSDDYQKIIDEFDSYNLKIVLKHVLSNIEYFVIYYRYLNNEKKTLEELSSYFNITKERIRQIEVVSLKKIKPYLNEKSSLFRNTLAKIQEREKNNFDNLSIKALSPNNIIVYWYLKDELTQDERLLYEEIVFGKYQPKLSIFVKLLHKSPFEINNILERIKNKRKQIDVHKFNSFKENLIRNYGTEIFRINQDERRVIDYSLLEEKYASLSLEEILELFNDAGYVLSDSEKSLLERFYGKLPKSTSYANEIEKEINVLKFGFRNKGNHPPLNKLYEEYLRIKDDFTSEQQLYLECFLFHHQDPKEFIKLYPQDSHNYQRVITRLERSYYHIFDYFDRTFTKEMWEEVKVKYMERFTPYKIKLLDMEYGVDGKKYTREEIAEYFNMDKDKISHDLRSIIKYANSLYIGLSNRIDIDKSLYIPYIKDNRYELFPETRKILSLFMILNKTYDEISLLTGLSKNSISNIITAGVRRIDNYRFGLISPFEISEKDLDGFYNYYPKADDLWKKIVSLKYLEHFENRVIAEKLNISLKDVNLIVARFNDLYYLFQVKDVSLSDSDLIHQVNLHISESVLNEKERQLLSLLLGIKNNDNPQGKKYSKKEILDILKISNNTFKNSLTKIRNYVKGYKIGIRKSENIYITRDMLNNVLDDIHLPISRKEYDLICSLFELKGYPYKDFDELEKEYHENKSSLKERYQRAIVSIYKYLNHEIDGNINYDVDIYPLLKYFSKCDREKIIDFYRDNLSYETMSKKYQLSFGKISGAMQRINATIYELRHNPHAKRFDFDYYLEVIDKVDLPFYGDIEIAKKIFNLIFGMQGNERMSAQEVINELNLDIEVTSVNRIIASLMLAVCKYKDGIVKEKTFTKEEIVAFYESQREILPEWHFKFYDSYLKKINDPKRLNETRSNISYIVINDLVKSLYSDAFILNKATKEEVLNILHKYGKDIMRRVRIDLMTRFGITEREFMSGRERYHLYRLLDRLDNLRKGTKNLTKC